MSKRDPNDELAFGSDSFLDVVANIVGILIILIVVAGLRVSRAPVVDDEAASQPLEQSASTQEPVIEELPEAAPMEIAALQFPNPEPLPVPEPVFEPRPLPRPDPTPPPELVARADELQQAIDALSAGISEKQDRQRALQDQLARDAPQVAKVQQSLAEAEAARRELEQQADALAATISSREQALEHLRADLLTAQADGPKTEVLSHRVTPLGREVAGPELHFRLEGNRVSVVPVESLANELKARIERNRDSLLRMQRYEGEVGPIDGYKMRYMMQQERASVLEELRFGQGFVKMSVVFWELLPQEGFPTESGDEAVRRGSRFYTALQQAGPDATITFWVYPDSFELHRRLQEFVHSAGYEVAGRPLPYGVPIAGSPNGSRSVAQ
jgi:hypothetical protein